jgi:sterol desaturase/sphingolipid hydroxylase (fatty acid hydroxylase superfamily)
LHGRHFRWLGHDIHHRTAASKSITACYMSAADFFLNIVAPYLLPLVLIGGGGSDIRFHVLVAGVATIGGLYEHSGYDFAPAFCNGLLRLLPPSFTSSRAHGEHHRRWQVSFSDGFGSPGLCDLIFATRWDRR